ncbi:uncharacterized protein VTP21DRAFT_1624 [Calcarisporiella thermophila]|uniref:uncharacterized protein n=1 Tax=Calcarisporiella thermophila TaxID=911321 RepID=UPI00374212C7
MTRTCKHPASTDRDVKHYSRNGFSSDPRVIVKKRGAGRGNWGREGDEMAELSEDATFIPSTSPTSTYSKIVVVSSASSD